MMKVDTSKRQDYRAFLKELALPCLILLVLVVGLHVLGDVAARKNNTQMLGKCFGVGADAFSEEVNSVISVMSKYGVVL